MIGRGNQNTSGAIFRVIILGIFVGFGFILFNRNANTPGGGENTPLPSTLEPLSSPTAPALTTIMPGTDTPVALQLGNVRLYIPNANVVSNIVPVFLGGTGSWNIQFLGGNVGHLQGTGWIDAPGNIVLAGHIEQSDGTPGIFAGLSQIAFGDDVILEIEGERRVYTVSTIRETSPQDLSVLYPTPVEQVTLITCDQYDFISNSYLARIVVTALRVS